MQIPDYAARPLSQTFVIVRGLSLIAMLGIVGMTANFVAQITGSGVEAPKEIVGTLCVVSWAPSPYLPQKASAALFQLPRPILIQDAPADDIQQTCLATLYTLISIPIFLSTANLGLLIMTGIDSLILLAFIVVSVVLGKPLSLLNCYAIANTSAETSSANVAYWLASVVQNVKHGEQIGLYVWAGSTRANCLETKAIWGMGIALW